MFQCKFCPKSGLRKDEICYTLKMFILFFYEIRSSGLLSLAVKFKHKIFQFSKYMQLFEGM